MVTRLFFLKQVFETLGNTRDGLPLNECASEGLAEILEDMLRDTMDSRNYYSDYIEAEGERARQVQS